MENCIFFVAKFCSQAASRQGRIESSASKNPWPRTRSFSCETHRVTKQPILSRSNLFFLKVICQRSARKGQRESFVATMKKSRMKCVSNLFYCVKAEGRVILETREIQGTRDAFHIEMYIGSNMDEHYY